MEENMEEITNHKKRLRTLTIVQVLTIVILVLILINQSLPFLGIAPIGSQNTPMQFHKSGGYVSPAHQKVGDIDDAYLAKDLILFTLTINRRQYYPIPI